MTIFFYSTRDAHGGFSNFSRHGFTLKEVWWPTSEHYFQAQKFAGTAHEDAIRSVPTPRAAADMGRDRRRMALAQAAQSRSRKARTAASQRSGSA